MEARPLLVAERRHREVVRRRGSAVPHLLGARDPDQDAEGAVVTSGIDDGVEVRADHERRPVVARGRRTDQVPDPVDTGRHPGRPHPPVQQPARLEQGRGAVAARDLARHLGACGQFVGP